MPNFFQSLLGVGQKFTQAISKDQPSAKKPAAADPATAQTGWMQYSNQASPFYQEKVNENPVIQGWQQYTTNPITKQPTGTGFQQYTTQAAAKPAETPAATPAATTTPAAAKPAATNNAAADAAYEATQAAYKAETKRLVEENLARTKQIEAQKILYRDNKDSEMQLANRRNQGYKKGVRAGNNGSGNISSMSTNQAQINKINIGKSTGG